MRNDHKFLSLCFGLGWGFPRWLSGQNLPYNAGFIGEEMWVQTLGWEDPLEVEMEVHSSILFWIIPWTEETCRLQTLESELDMAEVTEYAWAWPKFSPRSIILSTLENSLGYSFWITISYITSICFPDTAVITYLLLLRASLKNYYPIFDLHKHIVQNLERGTSGYIL